MRFTTHELTRNGWSGKNLCYLPRLAAQLTLYEKNGAFLTHWFAILAQSTLLENFSLRKSLLFCVRLLTVAPVKSPRESGYLEIEWQVTFCFIYAVRIWPPLLGSKKWIQEYPWYLPRRPLSLGPSSSIALRLCGIPCANSSVLFFSSSVLGFMHFIQSK